MAYSDVIKLVTGDTLPELTFTLKDSNSAAAGAVLDQNNSNTWAPIDVTGAEVRLRIRAIGSSEVKSTLLCSVVDGPAGKVITDFPAGTLDTPGTFEAELEARFPNGGIQTVHDLIKLKVRGDFD